MTFSDVIFETPEPTFGFHNISVCFSYIFKKLEQFTNISDRKPLMATLVAESVPTQIKAQCNGKWADAVWRMNEKVTEWRNV